MSYLKNIHSIEAEINMTGKYMGKTAYAFQLMGRRAGFTSTSVMNDVKEFDNGVADIPNLSNSTLDLVCLNANDTAAGTGIQSVKVVYINNSNNLIESASIPTNGGVSLAVLTGVNFVLWMEGVAGSGGVSSGNIKLRINGGTVEVEQITAGGNKSMSAQCMIPTGYKGYVTRWRTSSVSSRQRTRLRATVNSFDRSLSTTWHFQDIIELPADSSQSLDLPYLKFPALCKLKAATISSATASANTVDVSFTILLIQD